MRVVVLSFELIGVHPVAVMVVPVPPRTEITAIITSPATVPVGVAMDRDVPPPALFEELTARKAMAALAGLMILRTSPRARRTTRIRVVYLARQKGSL